MRPSPLTAVGNSFQKGVQCGAAEGRGLGYLFACTSLYSLPLPPTPVPSSPIRFFNTLAKQPISSQLVCRQRLCFPVPSTQRHYDLSGLANRLSFYSRFFFLFLHACSFTTGHGIESPAMGTTVGRASRGRAGESLGEGTGTFEALQGD